MIDVKTTVLVLTRNADMRYHKEMEIEGKRFPLPLTKRMVSTFGMHDDWGVFLVEDELRFFWQNGRGHINSIEKAKAISEEIRAKRWDV
jgi:hypothetical protein